jgi:peptidyl-prolyl cis-trans isomerase B (cyclophilin B)
VAGKKERQRKLARERYLRQQAKRAEHARRLRLVSIITGACVVLAGLGTVLYLAFGGGSKTASASSATPTPAASASASASASPAAAAVSEPAHHCTYTSSPPAARTVSMPPTRPDYKARYRASIKTNRGTIVIDLLNSKATCTVNSFVSLATQKYFSKTPCHRLTTSGIYVLQCGDPTGTGSGGPGYKFADENLAGAKYTAGTVAMANSGPGTNGSQFFIVYRDSLTLPANYTPFGTVVSGMGIVQNVAKAGTSNGTGDGHPKEKVVIESVHITKT